jgi:plastocyanin
MRTRRLLPIAALLTLLGSGALPCHSGPTPASAQGVPAPLEIHITLREWSLLPAQINVPVGRTVRFLAQNAGFLPHALTIQGDGVFAESATAGAGDTVRLDVFFSAPGTYDVYCPVNAGEHRALGQEGELRVLGATSSLVLPATGSADLSPLDPSAEDHADPVDAPLESE